MLFAIRPPIEANSPVYLSPIYLQRVVYCAQIKDVVGQPHMRKMVVLSNDRHEEQDLM